MGKFGSRSIALRPHLNITSQKHQAITKYWTGPFRFFDLPPELRDHIIRLLLFDLGAIGRYPTRLFLTCRRIYAEAASIFYDEVFLENINPKGTPDPFLTNSLTWFAPRQYVRNLRIKFDIKDQIHLFGEFYGTALNEMAEEGNLQRLQLEIENCFPSCEFWGYEDDLSTYGNILVPGGRGKGTVISGPLFITRTPFQSFLKFLDDSQIPKITLLVDARDHAKFWCPFHRVHSRGRKCDGQWKGGARLLRISCSNLVKALRGARAMGPVDDC
ncbi:hypothetical protein F4776DRAFT_651721 [Hypoxylon sp. NC0597]|nr:hypothetical protein F4776DRAFT_651721 [Hypoxylon sp. NC0597]